jgi:hypothetical protein
MLLSALYAMSCRVTCRHSYGRLLEAGRSPSNAKAPMLNTTFTRRCAIAAPTPQLPPSAPCTRTLETVPQSLSSKLSKTLLSNSGSTCRSFLLIFDSWPASSRK